MSFRRILFWSHLVTAVALGLVVLLLAGTGLLLTYERQIIAWAEDRAVPAAAGRAPLAPDAIIAAATQAGARPGSSIAFAADPGAAVRVTTGRREGFLLDPYSGAVLEGAGEATRGFFATVTGLHRWLALPGEGRAAGGPSPARPISASSSCWSRAWCCGGPGSGAGRCCGRG